MSERKSGRLFKLALVGAAVGGLVFGVRHLRVKAAVGSGGAACVGDINRLTNPSGFTSSDFASSTAVQVSSAGAQPIALDTNLVPLDPQKIKLPFDQDVTVKYVYRNAGASHMLGWFYLDDLKTGPYPLVKTDASGNDYLADNDVDGVFDWFQTLKGPTRPRDGLFHQSSAGTVDLASSSLNYQDGASWYHKHVPHVLEVLSGVANSNIASDHTGDFIFQNCDDDTDTSTWNGYAPAADTSVVAEGIADYDVNNDGIIGNEADRTVDLGIVKGNKEIVFFAVTFWSADLPNAGVGLTGGGSTTVRSLPWFTKNILNPDRGQKGANTVLRKQAIGCERDDSTCFTPLGADLGWLDLATIARLKTPTYHNIVLDNTVNIIKTDAAGNVPHFVVNAPSTDPNRWIMALDDTPAASADLDYNDVVFLIERINGGEVISKNQIKPGDIPGGMTANDIMVSKIRFRFTAQYPSPGCDTVPDADIQFSWSVDGGVSWNPMGLPAHKTSGDLAIDVLGKGIVGHQLIWKATFVSSSQYCQPKLTTANMGYEAIPHGEYKFAAPAPLANVVFNGTVETPSSTWATTASDFSLRGHFYSTPLFDPASGNDISPSTPSWDSGAVLAAQPPSTRLGLFTNNNGAYMALTSANGTAALGATTLYKNVLTATDRALKIGGQYLFDYTGDALVDDKDALYVLEWTRGWEAATITGSPPTATGTTARAWKLGALHNSSPAIVGPPGHPPWLDGTNTSLSAFKTAYTGATWQGNTSAIMGRRTLGLFGAADGMLHAVDAGNFHNPFELVCSSAATRLVRGCFAPAGSGSTPDYGTGKEVWAYVPPTLLNALKNNTPKIRNSTSEPSYPQAEVDGSVAVEDIYYTPTNSIAGRPANQFVTAAVANLGRQWSALTAVGWTTMAFSGSTPVSTTPFPLWSQDFTDRDFLGGPTSPAIGVAITPSGVKWVVVATSGLANPAIDGTQDEFLYVLDASTGWVLGATTAPGASPTPNKPPLSGAYGKVTLDAAGTTAYGFSGFPNMVDSDQDGVYDRAYVVDTAGRVYRVDLKLLTACKIATLGEPVFAGMGTSVVGTSKVRLYAAGGSNPDGTDSPPSGGTLPYPPYHVFGLEDSDVAGTATCTTAKIVYKFAAPNNEKVWAAPFVSDTTVYVASSGSSEAGICANASGSFFGLSVDGNGASTNPAPLSASGAIVLNNAGISSIRIYDGHAFINGISQQTAVVGKPGWNNKSPGGSGPNGPTMSTLKWSEQ